MGYPVGGKASVDARARLEVALETAGISDELIGDILADIGDLREAVEVVHRAFLDFATGGDRDTLLDRIESEARDHMPGHIASLRRTVRRLRRRSQ